MPRSHILKTCIYRINYKYTKKILGITHCWKLEGLKYDYSGAISSSLSSVLCCDPLEYSQVFST